MERYENMTTIKLVRVSGQTDEWRQENNLWENIESGELSYRFHPYSGELYVLLGENNEHLDVNVTGDIDTDKLFGLDDSVDVIVRNIVEDPIF